MATPIMLYGNEKGKIIVRLIVIALAALSLALACADDAEQVLPGRWGRDGVPSPEVLEMLGSLHYLQGYEPAPDVQGVVTYDSSLACNGLNLIISGHAPEAVLTDMEGTTLHTWNYPFDRIWKDGPPRYLPETTGREYWRRVRLLADGSLLAIFEGQCLIKIDRESRLLWTYPMQAHHDMDVAEDGTVYALIREGGIHPAISVRQAIVEDFVVVLSPDGNESERFSLVDCFLDSEHSSILEGMAGGDIFHTNALRILNGSLSHLSRLFGEGNLLVSLGATSTIVIINPETKEPIWTATGTWVAQHDPTLMANGNILLFDNLGDEGNSRVIELNALTDEIEWSFASTPERTFCSKTCGTCQRLPNGNTLITESDSGRALEVTPEGTVVWEYVNPHRAGENGELIATLLDVIRITETPVWLGR